VQWVVNGEKKKSDREAESYSQNQRGHDSSERFAEFFDKMGAWYQKKEATI
jgi:hypothetical protein